MTVKTYNGDCLKILPTLPDNSVDMVLADLPYGVLSRSNKTAKWDNIIPMEPLWSEIRRVAKPNAAIVLFGQGMFSAQLMVAGADIWRYNLIWEKPDRPTGFLNAKKMPLREHEDIMVFYEQQPTYNPQMVYAGPHKRNHSRGKQEKEATNRCYGKYGKADAVMSDYKYPRSIIEVPRDAKTVHPTQKPVALCEWLIRTYSNPGDVVLDPTMGSGSTGIACQNTGRSFIGIEMTEEYSRIANERMGLGKVLSASQSKKTEANQRKYCRTGGNQPGCQPRYYD